MRETAEHGGLEVEWQFGALELERVERWLMGEAVAGFRVTLRERISMRDVYFDTDGWRLNRAGYTCRVRETRGRFEVTVKGGTVVTGSLKQRREVNEPVEAGVSPTDAPGEAGALAREAAGGEAVRELFVLETERSLFDVGDGGGVFGEVALDRTRIAGAEEPMMLRVEVEVGAGDVARAEPFVEAMVAACGLAERPASKFGTGMAWALEHSTGR